MTPKATMLSTILHVLALSLCGLIVLNPPRLVEEIFTTVVENEEVGEPIVDRSMLITEEIKDRPLEEPISPEFTSHLEFDLKGPIDLNVNKDSPQLEKASGDGQPAINIKIGEMTSGRMSAQNKKLMVEKYGGNSASEAAVAAGIRWLEYHQASNGSWSFEHASHPACKGQCSQNGTFNHCYNGATGLAMLTFLGAGHTHLSGDYKKQVSRAVDFLLKSAKQTKDGLDLRGAVMANEGMYVQGLCTIALCECAAMTDDSRVRKAAKGALQFIVNAQNAADGGWRYYPGSPGDTSVTGWQVMALKSGQSASIEFPNKAFKGVKVFLDQVASERGTRYAYMPDTGRRRSGATESMTAVGLLCRMYLGWDRSSPQLANGIEYLDTIKPMADDMYFNYYATQVMHHWGGEEWKRWNELMRNQLVRTQRTARDGHMAGSWDIADPHGGSGGRLYMTCLSTMTLEIYYRHLPLYNLQNLKAEF